MLLRYVIYVDKIIYIYILLKGNRACPGKLQRKGKAGVLGCHKIDLDELDHMDIFTLRKFLSEDSEILGRKITGLCAKCQRQVKLFSLHYIMAIS